MSEDGLTWLVNSKSGESTGPFTTEADAIHALRIAEDRDNWQLRPSSFRGKNIRDLLAEAKHADPTMYSVTFHPYVQAELLRACVVHARARLEILRANPEGRGAISVDAHPEGFRVYGFRDGICTVSYEGQWLGGAFESAEFALSSARDQLRVDRKKLKAAQEAAGLPALPDLRSDPTEES